MRILEALGARPRKWLAETAKISESTLSDGIAKGIAKAEVAVAIARALGVTTDWLLTGFSANQPNMVMDISDADWMELPEYDLRKITDDTKGELIGRATFRRDWLYLALGESNDLWITRTLTPDAARGLPVGSAIVCKDHPRGESPIEGRFYIFRVGAGVLLARFSYRTGAFAAGDRVGETVVTPADLDREDGQHFIIARVLGALARPLV